MCFKLLSSGYGSERMEASVAINKERAVVSLNQLLKFLAFNGLG